MTADSRGVLGWMRTSFWRSHVVALPVVLVVMSTTLLSGFGWVAVHEANRTVQDDAQARVRSNRDAAVRALVHQTDDFKAAVTTTATNVRIIDSLQAPTPATLAQAQDYLTLLARSKGSPGAFLADAQGRAVAVYPRNPPLIGRDFSFRDWFLGASRTGGTYVSAAYRTASSGHPLVVGVASPVLNGSEHIGYIVVLWQLDSVRAVAEGSRKDDGVAILVTDQHGQPLTDALTVDVRGQAQPTAVSATTKQALSGRAVDTVIGGMLESAGPVPKLGWTVTAAQPTSIALAPADTFRRSLGVALGIALLLVLLLALFVWRVALRRAVERGVLRDSEERFRRVFDEALIGKLLANIDGEILQVNSVGAQLLNRAPAELIGQSFAGLFEDESDRTRIQELVQAGDGELRAEMSLSDVHGQSLWVLVGLSWMHELDGEGVLLAQVEDITARRAAEQRLTELALHDELTGMPNRRLLLERCEQAFARARSGRGDSTSVAALFIDLDGFKPINDNAGHDAGDQVLVAVANDLVAALRPADTVARVGGDEFVVLLDQHDGLAFVRSVAERITATIRRQVTTDTTSLTLSASVGIARVDLAQEPDVSPELLLRRADAAMYLAKERGRDRYGVFDSDLHERTEAWQGLVQAMRDGLHHDRVALVFQPVVDVDSNIVVGAEALMRLTNTDGRLLPTLPVVVAAETAGLAEELGDRVLHLALGAACTWPEHMSLAVNISTRELTGRDLRKRVERALRLHDFDPARLILEITETSILRAGGSAIAELEKLRQQGVRVAIDDFGTAYATLANLTRLPVDVLKVDTSFTTGLPHQRTHTAIVHGIASMAYELDIPCIIEGVETIEQLDAIRGMSVQAQGWFWGKPQGPESVPMLNPLQRPPQPDPATRPRAASAIRLRAPEKR
jgi:diguanylate cyclase (GGDEF)-like protein/PAS domain S-box-containing protein